MDGFTAAATVLGAIKTTGDCISSCVEYARKVKHADADISRLRDELEILEKILQQAKSLCNENTQTRTPTASDTALKEAIDECSKQLSDLLDKLNPDKAKKWTIKIKLRELQWPFKSKEVEEAVRGLARHRGNITLAIQIRQSARLDTIDTKFDLTKLPLVTGAVYNAFSDNDDLDSHCLPDTRVDLLQHIREWVTDPASKSVFWLNGMAGTGKSTIARTVAQEFDKNHQLGASFFFKNGEVGRGNASRLFTSIANQLFRFIPEIQPKLKQVLQDDPDIAGKGLRLQFDGLILNPLQDIKITSRPLVVIVVDALDECENDSHIKNIVQLLAQLQSIPSTTIRILITSRPELPPRLGFQMISTDNYQDFILHQIAQPTIEHDIMILLEHKFKEIRFESGLPTDWPLQAEKEALRSMAVPLFIFAVTVCRFIAHSSLDPREQLKVVLEYQHRIGLDQMDKTYKPVLDRLLEEAARNEVQQQMTLQNFRDVVGTIVVLADPLSINSLASLLQIEPWSISRQLNSLHSVLDITNDLNRPVRPLHLSFPNYLLDSERQGQHKFWIDAISAHKSLAYKCIDLLQRSEHLKRDICNLQWPGTARSEVSSNTLLRCLPLDLRYACFYWTHHLERGQCQLSDEDEAHHFLKERLLYWLEALSLLGRISIAVGMVATLQGLLSAENSSELALLLKDAYRFIMTNLTIAEEAPLQLYCWSLAFAPRRSVISQVYSLPKWLVGCRPTREKWNASLQTLEDRRESYPMVMYHRDGKQLIIYTQNQIEFRDTTTFTIQQEFSIPRIEQDIRYPVISPDGKLQAFMKDLHNIEIWDIASASVRYVWKAENLPRYKDPSKEASWYRPMTFSCTANQLIIVDDQNTIKMLDLTTTVVQQIRRPHMDQIFDMIYARVACVLVTAAADGTVKTWNTITAQLLQTLFVHQQSISGRSGYMAISANGTQLACDFTGDSMSIWDTTTGTLQHVLEPGNTRSMAFSPDGRQLALGHTDENIQLWNTSSFSLQQILDGHVGSVRSLTFSPTSKQLASGSFDSTVKIWETTAEKDDIDSDYTGSTSSIVCLNFSLDGEQLATGSEDGTVKLWNTDAGSLLWEISRPSRAQRIFGLEFSKDGRLLASLGYTHTIGIWNLVTRTVKHQITTSDVRLNWPVAIAFSFDGLRIAGSLRDGSIHIWNLNTGQREQHMGRTSRVFIQAINFTPDGRLLASASSNRSQIDLWNTTTGGLYRSIATPNDIEDLSWPGLSEVIRELMIRLPDHACATEWLKNEAVCLDFDDGWVTFGGKRLLWLHHEYRTHTFDSTKKTLALGTNIGRVVILEFSLSEIEALAAACGFGSGSAAGSSMSRISG